MESFRGETHPSLKYLELTEDVHQFGDILRYATKLETLKYRLDPEIKFGELSHYLQSVKELKYLTIFIQDTTHRKVTYDGMTPEDVDDILTAISEHCQKLKVNYHKNF